MAHSPYRKCHYCKATDQQFERRRSFERRAWTLFKNSGRMCCPNCQRKGREDERLATVQRIRTIQRHKAFASYLMEMEAQYTTSVLSEPVVPYGAPPAALKQYKRIKATHPDAVLLFRDGDRYQSFGPDADTCYHVLGLVRTEILPSGLVMLAKKSKVFTKAHGLCHVSLKQLEARIEELEERIWQSALPIRAERTMKAEVFMLKNVVLDRRKNNRARLAGKN